MEVFGATLLTALNLMRMEFTVYGITLSYWEVFIWSAFVIILLKLIYGLWSG